MTIDIRDTVDSDIELLYDLYQTMGHKPDGYFEHCFEEQKAGNRDILIAFKEERAVGYAMLNWKPRYSLYKKLGIPEIQDLNVIPDARRQGVATALIAECERRTTDRGHDAIGVSVGLTGAYGPAQRLYWSLNYAPDGQGVTYDRQAVQHAELRPVDDLLCLMLVKGLLPSQKA